MTNFRRDLNNQGCCNSWQHGIRTINGQYPDDNREFGIIEGAGILITPETAGIKVTCTIPTADTLTAGDNISITPGGSNELIVGVVPDPIINGTLQVNGDIIQNGAAYETHAEKLYTTNDYIITRDGAISALSAGDYSGFQVKKYDGTNDGRLVIDNSGVARVGDVGDEQPLLTRSESAQLNNGDLLQWNSTSQKAVSASLNTSQIIRGSGNIGSDTKPIKIVNGVATPVTDDLIKKSSLFFSQGSIITTGSSYVYYGFVDTATRVFITINLPKLLDRPFTLEITTMEVKGVNGSFTLSSNPISSIATNNQTFDTIRVAVTFTNAHGLTLNTPISGFLTYKLTVN